MTTPIDSEDTMLSRSGNSDPGGKLVKRLDIPVSEELEEGVIALATLAGIPKAEFLRRAIERLVFGELLMARRMTRSGLSGPWDQSPTNARD